MKFSKLPLLAAILSVAPGIALAQLEGITAGELALTPPYCQDAQTMNGWSKTKPSPRTAYWISLMGEGFWTMHHQCWALIRNRRAMMPGVSPMYRTAYLRHSVGDFEFIIRNTSADFVLLPEIYYGLGETYLLMGEMSAAYEALYRARAIKPDYWPAYTRWADELLKLNLRADARQLLEEGLSRVPDAKPVIERLVRLGVDPEPLRAQAKARLAAQAASAPAPAGDPPLAVQPAGPSASAPPT